jgi:hypothetical protein
MAPTEAQKKRRIISMRKLVIGLVAVAVVSMSAAVLFAADHAYVGADKCKMCHKIQHTSWLETFHAKATDNAKASTARKFEPACLKCHATNGDEAMPGVQCEACHGAGADYKSMTIMKNLEQAKAAGLVVPTQETCAKCHTGQDHSKAVKLDEQKANKKAIHEFKPAAPPA